MVKIFWMVPFVVLLGGLGVFIFLRMEEVMTYSFSLGPFFESSLEMTLSIDSFSLIFVMMVGFVSSLVLGYSNDYFGEGFFFKKKFFFIMISFICSMFILSLSGDLFWVMVGWDGLGITSFYLIIFYQSWKSFNSAMVTFLTNRLGDFFMISSVVILLMVKGDVKFWSESSFWVVWFMILGALTKSAQVPFSGWLPLAMAAPTPVSSLVHSSTLVTAGVYIMIRFNSFLSESMKTMIYYIGIMTVFLAGISSIGEYDLKKVIALSTLSHIGVMVMFIGMGSILSAKIHLVIHALFKSVLFMAAGSIIHMSNGCQDLRLLTSLFLNMSTSSTFLVSALSMMGAPFLAGFFSKEIMYDSSFSLPSLLSFFGFLSSAMMTCMYSCRLIFYLYMNKSTMSPVMTCETNMKLVFLLGIIFSSVIGSSMVSVLIEKEFTEKLSVFSLFMKASLFLMVTLGLLLGSSAAKHFKLLPQSMKLASHSMWMIHSISKVSQKNLFSCSHIYMFQLDIKGSIDSMMTYIDSNMSVLSDKWVKKLIVAPLNSINLMTLGFIILFFF